MSDNNPNGRRYSLRLAGESAAQDFDPFANNDFSDQLSHGNTNDNSQTTPPNDPNHRSQTTSFQSPINNSSQPPNSIARDSDLSSDDAPFVPQPSTDQDEDLSFGSDGFIFDFLNSTNSPVASRLRSNQNHRSNASSNSSRMTSHSERIKELEKTMNSISKQLQSDHIESAIASAIAKALGGQNPINQPTSSNHQNQSTSSNTNPSTIPVSSGTNPIPPNHKIGNTISPNQPSSSSNINNPPSSKGTSSTQMSSTPTSSFPTPSSNFPSSNGYSATPKSSSNTSSTQRVSATPSIPTPVPAPAPTAVPPANTIPAFFSAGPKVTFHPTTSSIPPPATSNPSSSSKNPTPSTSHPTSFPPSQAPKASTNSTSTTFSAQPASTTASTNPPPPPTQQPSTFNQNTPKVNSQQPSSIPVVGTIPAFFPPASSAPPQPTMGTGIPFATGPPNVSHAPPTQPPVFPSAPTPQQFIPNPMHVPSTQVPRHSFSMKDLLIVLKSFPKRNTQEAYLQWKTQSLLVLSTHFVYPSITTRNAIGSLVLNPHITHTDNVALFTAITNSLGDRVSKFVDVSDYNFGNGVELWQRIESMVMGDVNAYSTQEVLRKYHQLHRHPQQSIQAFGSKFISLIEIMHSKEVKAGTMKDQALHFLMAVNMPKIFKDHIKDIDSCKSWWHQKTLRYFIDKVNREYQTLKDLGALPNEYLIKENQQQQDKNNNKTKTPPPSDTSKPTKDPLKLQTDVPTPPPSGENRQPAHLQPNALEFKRQLLADQSEAGVRSVLFKWYNSYHSMCCFHNGAKSHNFLQCYVTDKICQECNTTDLLNTVKHEYGIAPTAPPTRQPSPTHNAHQSYGIPPTTTNPPPPPPPPRPTYNPPPRPLQQVQNPYRPRQQQQQVRFNQSQQANPYYQRNANSTTPPPAPANRNAVNARMAQLINARADEIASARVAQYFEEMQQDDFMRETSIGGEEEGNFDHGPTEEETEVDNNDNNETVESYSVSSQVVSSCQPSSSPPIIAKSRYSPTNHQLSPINSNKLPPNFWTAVIDSGATDTLSPILELFDTITYFYESDKPPSNTPHVMLGDDKTLHPIKGYGTITYTLCGKTIRQFCYYVPDLGKTTLISVKQHAQYQGNYFTCIDNKAILAFPTFVLSLSNMKEICAIITTAKHPSLDYDETKAIYSKGTRETTTSLIPENIKQYIPKCKRVQFQEIVEYKPLHRHAKIPTRATDGSIGFDVYSTQSVEIQPNSIKKIPTGVSMALPSTMYCRIAPRSGLALKGLSVEGGVVDADYRGEYMVLLRNNTSSPINIDFQQKIAQLIFEKAAIPMIKSVSSLPPSSRNNSGFGSSDTPSPTPTTSPPMSPLLPTIPPKAPSSKLINRKQNWPHSQKKLTGHTDQFDPLDKPSQPTPPTVTFDDLQFISKIHPAHQSPLQQANTSIYIKNDKLPISSDKVASSVPESVTISRDNLAKAVGFRQTDFLIQHLPNISNKKLHIQALEKSPFIDPGEVASMDARQSNKKSSRIPSKYSDIWHIDIGYGPCTSIGGMKYVLIAVDKFSRYKLCYGLKNLTSSLLQAMKRFVRDVGKTPTTIRTDFDTKLIAGEVEDFLIEEKIQVEAAPPLSPTSERLSRKELAGSCKNGQKLAHIKLTSITLLVFCN